MSAKRHDESITRIETHIECWKQFNHFVNVARGKQFDPEDESHFIELKKIIARDLEMIFASVDVQSPTGREITAHMGRAPSLRRLSEMSEGELHDIEDDWHKIHVGWHSILGRLKMKQRGG